MKELLNYCRQGKAYGDSYGECVVEVEQGDNADDIIKEFTKKREWYEQTYSSPSMVKRYEYKKWNGTIQVFEGNLIVFKTYRTYLD